MSGELWFAEGSHYYEPWSCCAPPRPIGDFTENGAIITPCR